MYVKHTTKRENSKDPQLDKKWGDFIYFPAEEAAMVFWLVQKLIKYFCHFEKFEDADEAAIKY